MKHRFTLRQVITAAKWTGLALAIAYMAFSLFLIITLSTSEDDQDQILDLISDDNEADACRDRLEQDFLGIVGTIILRETPEEGRDQVLIDRLANSVDRLDRVEELCPKPERRHASDRD